MTHIPPTGLPPAKIVLQNSRCAYQMLSFETPHTISLLKHSPHTAFCGSNREGWSQSCPTSSLTKHKHTHAHTHTECQSFWFCLPNKHYCRSSCCPLMPSCKPTPPPAKINHYHPPRCPALNYASSCSPSLVQQTKQSFEISKYYIIPLLFCVRCQYF